MKNKMQVLAVAAALLMLSGCAAENPAPESSFSESKIEQTEAVRQEKPEEESNSQALPETESSSTESRTEEESKPPEETKVPIPSEKPVENKPSEETLPEQKPQATEEPPKAAETQQPTQTEMQPPVVQPEVSHPTEEPKPTTPPPSEQPPQESETPESIPEEEKPEIQIDDWIAFGKEYAQSIGLDLHPDAIDCWDTPITATDPAYLERDIKSRLNRYSKSDDITEVWLWAEDDGKGGYLLYIGYA